MSRTMACVLVVLLLGTACRTEIDGTPVTNAAPPQDIWQLTEQLVQRVPLTEQKFADLLGTSLAPNPGNPLRHEGGAVRFGPDLEVTSSVIAIIGGEWSFAAIDVAPTPCITEAQVKQRYPSSQLTDTPRGHSPMEQFLWTTNYDWGTLSFGIRELDQCLAGISVERAKG